MNADTFEAFELQVRAAGFDDIVERQWAADAIFDTHAHPFDVESVIVQGEMWLTCEGEVRHLTPGSKFTLARNTPHSERYGTGGATSWIARRHALK